MLKNDGQKKDGDVCAYITLPQKRWISVIGNSGLFIHSGANSSQVRVFILTNCFSVVQVERQKWLFALRVLLFSIFKRASHY